MCAFTAFPLVKPRVRSFVEIWHCEPPHAGVTYHVTADTWNDDHTERTIHTIEIVESEVTP